MGGKNDDDFGKQGSHHRKAVPTEDDDVQGHGGKDAGPEGVYHVPKAVPTPTDGKEDDVEGHGGGSHRK